MATEDYIGPFGPESIDAAQQVILSWAHSGDPADVGSARPVLSDAVSAVDRQALTERVAVALALYDGYDWDQIPVESHSESWAQADYRRQAGAAIAALFPRAPDLDAAEANLKIRPEGKAPDGE